MAMAISAGILRLIKLNLQMTLLGMDRFRNLLSARFPETVTDGR